MKPRDTDKSDPGSRLRMSAITLLFGAYTLFQCLLGCAPADSNDLSNDVSLPPRSEKSSGDSIDVGPLSAQQLENKVIIHSIGNEDRVIENAELMSASSYYIAYRKDDLTTLENERGHPVEQCAECNILVSESFAVIELEISQVVRVYSRRYGLIFSDSIPNQPDQTYQVEISDHFLKIRTGLDHHLFHGRKRLLGECQGDQCISGAQGSFGYISHTGVGLVQLFNKTGNFLHHIKASDLEWTFSEPLMAATSSGQVLVAHADRGIILYRTETADVRPVNNGLLIDTGTILFRVENSGNLIRLR